MFNELTQSGRIPGTLQGRGEGTEFIPRIYDSHRAGSIEQFYKQNGYVGRCWCILYQWKVVLISNFFLEYTTLQNQYQILQPQKYLKTTFPDGIALPTCFLSPNEVSLLEDSIDETIQQEDWLSAQVC